MFPGEVTNAKEEYRNIFKSIPVLFEYLLSTLQSKPEILENDNVMAFNDVPRHKRIDKRDVNKQLDDENNNGNFKEKVKRDSNNEHNAIERNTLRENIHPDIERASRNSDPIEDTARNIDTKNTHTNNVENKRAGPSDFKENGKRDLLSQIYAFFGLSGANEESEPEQEASDVYDPVETDETPAETNEECKSENNDDFLFTLEEAEQKILLVEKMLEEFNTEESK